MRILFVALGTEQLNISLLASILRRCGHDVGLAFSRHLFDDRDQLAMPGVARFFRDDADVIDQAVRFQPDIVCYSALTVTYRSLIDIAQVIKDRCGAISIFGGVHASAVPALVLEEPVVDYVCVGEGDFALPMLIAALAEGRRDAVIPNIAFRGPAGQVIKGGQMPFVQNLDSLPPFEKDLWLDHIAVDAAYLTMSSRGCPYRCTFCFNNFFANLGGERATSGKYVRQRSVDHFMAELVEAKRRFGIRYIHIIDDIFTLDTAWLQEFSRRYRREINVPFQCLSHSHFLDAERVQALAEAGCVWVQIGVQSADEEYKKANLRRPDKSARISQVLDLLYKAKIGAKTDHIFGLPGETIESQDLALRFYAEHPGLRRVGTFWLTYLPGTEIIDDGLRAGAISQEQMDRINRGETDFWHREGNVRDPQMRRRYLEYEALLRLVVYLPVGLRGRLEPRHIRHVPASVLKLLGVLISSTISAVQRDPDLTGFLARYRHGLINHLRWRMGWAPRRRFAQGDLSPLHDAAWDALFEQAQRQLRAKPAQTESMPLSVAVIPRRAGASAGAASSMELPVAP